MTKPVIAAIINGVKLSTQEFYYIKKNYLDYGCKRDKYYLPYSIHMPCIGIGYYKLDLKTFLNKFTNEFEHYLCLDIKYIIYDNKVSHIQKNKEKFDWVALLLSFREHFKMPRAEFTRTVIPDGIASAIVQAIDDEFVNQIRSGIKYFGKLKGFNLDCVVNCNYESFMDVAYEWLHRRYNDKIKIDPFHNILIYQPDNQPIDAGNHCLAFSVLYHFEPPSYITKEVAPSA